MILVAPPIKATATASISRRAPRQQATPSVEDIILDVIGTDKLLAMRCRHCGDTVDQDGQIELRQDGTVGAICSTCNQS
jgi:hypothetical protein